MRDGFRNVDLIHGHEMFEQRLHIRGNAEHGKMLRSKELLVAHVGKELKQEIIEPTCVKESDRLEVQAKLEPE